VRKIYVVLIIVLLLTSAGCTSSVISPTTSTPKQVPYQQEVEELIKHSLTFEFDGIADIIKFTNITGSTNGTSTEPVKDWEFTVEYQTGHPGHGDRTGQALAQVVTNHNATIKVRDGTITSAFCDNIWDVLTDKNLSDEESARQVGIDLAENGRPC
jgi:hypothetical protein